MARKSRGNVAVTFNGTAITAYCNKADLDDTIEQLEVTNLASTGKEMITGDPEWSIALEGMWEVALDTAIGVEAVTPGTKRTAVIAFTGASQTVSYTWTSNAEIQDYKISAQVGGFITWSATLALSGAPTRAVA